MKFTTPLIATITGLAAAQNLEGQPACAVSTDHRPNIQPNENKSSQKKRGKKASQISQSRLTTPSHLRPRQTPCLTPAISAVCTPATDTACACASQSAIGAQAAPCLLSACTDPADLIAAESAGAAQCAAATGVSSSSSGTLATATTTDTDTDTDTATVGSGDTTTAAAATATGATSSASAASGSAAAPGATSPSSGGVLLGPAVGGGILGGTLFAVAVLL